MQWLDVYVPEPGWVSMRRLDDRFWKLSVKRLDYDFDTAGEYTGRELDAALNMVAHLAHGRRNHDHAVLQSTSGQSVIIGADEAAELLPNLRRAIEQARSGAED